MAILEHAKTDRDEERGDGESVEGRGETEERRDGKERGWTEKEERDIEREGERDIENEDAENGTEVRWRNWYSDG